MSTDIPTPAAAPMAISKAFAGSEPLRIGNMRITKLPWLRTGKLELVTDPLQWWIPVGFPAPVRLG